MYVFVYIYIYINIYIYNIYIFIYLFTFLNSYCYFLGIFVLSTNPPYRRARQFKGGWLDNCRIGRANTCVICIYIYI